MAVKKFSQHLHNSAGMRNSFTRATGPDGPLSWFIAALCFLVSLLYSSIYRCSGIFYTSMMTTYGTTRAQASMPFAIYGGFSHLSSLPAGPLIQACGVRFSAFVGGVLISLGFLVSAFATGIPFLIVSIGVLAGSGHGVLLSCVIVGINNYFKKKRGTALGFNLAGSASASFFFTNIFELCIAEYGIRTTISLTGALMLNIPVIAFLFRDPPWMQKSNSTKFKWDTEAAPPRHRGQCRAVTVTGYRESLCAGSISEKTISAQINSHVEAEAFISPIRNMPENYALPSSSLEGSVPNADTSEQLTPERKYSSYETHSASTTEEKTKNFVRYEIVLSAIDNRRNQQRSENKKSWHDSSPEKPDTQKAGYISTHIDSSPPNQVSTLGQKISASGTMSGPPDSASNDLRTLFDVDSLNLAASCLQVQNIATVTRDVTAGVACPLSQASVDDSSAKRPISRSIWSSCKEVLSMPRFYVHTVGYFSYCLFLDTLMCIVVDCATDRGISDSSAAHIITLFSVTDIAGRVLVPLFTDNHLIERFNTMTLCYLIIAIIGTSLPMVRINLAFAALVVALGLPMGYIMVAMPQTMAEDIGLNNLPIAFGFAAGFTAMGGFMTPVMIGFFRDTMGSYDGLLYFMAALLFTSFLLLCCVLITSKKSRS
nr:uncharacterized protein LOC129381970 [Dermacentor andersoni]